ARRTAQEAQDKAERLLREAGLAEGIKTGADLHAATIIMSSAEARAKYERGSAILRESKDALVDYARDSGLFSAKQAEAMKDLNRDHLVFRRVMEPDYQPPSSRGGILRPRSPTKAMKGSERQIVD